MKPIDSTIANTRTLRIPPRALAVALSSGLFVACDGDELEEGSVRFHPEPVSTILAAPASEPTSQPEPAPVMGDHMDVGPNVFAGSWSPGSAVRLPRPRDNELALVAPDLDPQVLRAHGAEPMKDLKIATTPAAGTITSPTGYGHYCSMTWPTGGWAFAWDTNGNDPCAYLIANSDPGGTIQRAGMFSASGTNQVVTRCTDGAVYIYRGAGGGPLSAAYGAANLHPGCIHTVAPQALPIFERSPFPSGTSIAPGTGVDFARGPAFNSVLDTTAFGHPSLPHGDVDATIVDFKGRARTGGWIDGHDAYDYGVVRGTDLYALANGNVIASRWLNTGCTGSDDPTQGEVYIRHTVARNPSTYNETFVAAYFHLQSLAALSPGTSVTSTTYLGDSGNTGCSSGPHLHFAVVRETNVADSRFFNLQVPTGVGNNGWGRTIDPYGWYAPINIDPWAWRAYPNGALSINLWKSGIVPIAPSQGNWGTGVD
jgi:murein DD-endopeptidase MepM/ murein hydrolase activator NlpD